MVLLIQNIFSIEFKRVRWKTDFKKKNFLERAQRLRLTLLFMV